jgi:hypothetical protein
MASGRREKWAVLEALHQILEVSWVEPLLWLVASPLHFREQQVSLLPARAGVLAVALVLWSVGAEPVRSIGRWAIIDAATEAGLRVSGLEGGQAVRRVLRRPVAL